MSNHLKKRLICNTIFTASFTALKDYLPIALFSAFLGCLVALPFIFINRAAIVEQLLKAAAAGFCIALVSRFTFARVFSLIRANTFWAFFSVFAVVGLGTLSGSYFLGMRVPLQLALITAAAELVGLSLCGILFVYSTRLNARLREKQKQIDSENA